MFELNELLQKIQESDPKFYSSLEDIIKYLASTYDDKYEKSDLPTKGVVYSDTLGKGFNVGNAAKYISRYSTSGFSKSEQTADLKKAIHYCLFELTRKSK